MITAEPLEEPRSPLLTLLISFGPTLLLSAAFVWLSAARPSAGGGMFGLGRSRARRYEPRRGAADHLRRRRRHRRGRERAGRDRRLPQAPRQVPAPGRHHPQGRAAGRAARHRQDAAGARRGRRGGRALLQHERLRVHRDDRRRRRGARARPVRRGQGKRRRRSSSSTSWTRSAGGAAAATSSAATTSASRRSTSCWSRWTASTRARR